MEYSEYDRLDGNVTRAFHKISECETYVSDTSLATFATSASASATSLSTSALATTTMPPTSVLQLQAPLTPISTSTAIALSYPLVSESKKIIIDNQMVMVYERQGFKAPFGTKQAEQMITMEEDISDLAKVFPPPRPKDSDVRDQHPEKVLKEYGSGNCGVYHFARWIAIG